MADFYRLEGHEVRPCSIEEFGAAMEDKRGGRVAATRVGDARISTVFLGMDHSWGGGPPLLFETLVFGGPLDDEMERYSTWEQAEAGHEAMVARVRASMGALEA